MIGETTLEGILVPVDWDASGRIRALALNTTGEHEVRLEGLCSGRLSLESLAGARVRIRGRILPAEILSVRRYQILELRDQPAVNPEWTATWS